MASRFAGLVARKISFRLGTDNKSVVVVVVVVGERVILLVAPFPAARQ
jgi:hypothetical protein